MDKVKWIRCGKSKFPSYNAEIGLYSVHCVPIVKNRNNHYRGDKYLFGWYGFVLLGNRQLQETTKRKSKKLAQKDLEKIVDEHLFCCGFLIIKELKRRGLLEEVLSEVGVDL